MGVWKLLLNVDELKMDVSSWWIICMFIILGIILILISAYFISSLCKESNNKQMTKSDSSLTSVIIDPAAPAKPPRQYNISVIGDLNVKNHSQEESTIGCTTED